MNGYKEYYTRWASFDIKFTKQGSEKACKILLLLPLWESVIVLCFVVRYFMSILVLQSS